MEMKKLNLEVRLPISILKPNGNAYLTVKKSTTLTTKDKLRENVESNEWQRQNSKRC
jgi:hypothetical protein